ncbi:META domain-containing protein [Aridibaculum aurantiacum]|uniref:META domain-containing protein n=1 Tax=Aridibaculum aurantiacum TaxID=2810307 RepID=UPI001A96B4EA|nr:META domain-containing protein [Aridibaculum aurantiacum]
MQAQDSILVTGEAYIPVEGRGETPGRLEGSWTLVSGVKAANKQRMQEVYKKKPAPGTETKRETTTTTETVGGGTVVTTETEIQMIREQEKQITPQQKEIMHKPQPPSISFFGKNHTFTGFTGCNRFAGRYTSSGNKLTIKAANPSTRMECIGEFDEKDFLEKINQVNSFRISNGRLHLMRGNDVLLVMAQNN